MEPSTPSPKPITDPNKTPPPGKLPADPIPGKPAVGTAPELPTPVSPVEA